MRLLLLFVTYFALVGAAHSSSITLTRVDSEWLEITAIDTSGMKLVPGVCTYPCQANYATSGITFYTPTTTLSCSSSGGRTCSRNPRYVGLSLEGLAAAVIGIRVPSIVSEATKWSLDTNNKLSTVYRAISTTLPNTGPPEPVHCSITGPSVLIHPGQKTTGVSSNVRDFWTVRCSGTSAMTISTKSDVKLRSGSDEIDSGLYIGDDGFTSMDFTGGDYPYPVSILSTLKSSTAQPGSYSGSGIITITWP